MDERASECALLKPEADKGVQSVERVLDIIEVLATDNAGLGVTEISNRVCLHKSTVHRLLGTLVQRGYAQKSDDGNYKIGLKLVEAVSCYINSLELQTEARPYLAQITANLGLTAHLGVLDGDKVVYIEKLDSFASLKMYSQVGMKIHAYCSSLGKCLLSRYSKKELEVVMKDCKFAKLTKNTKASIFELKKNLDEIRLNGWAIDNQEYELGHRCIGSPIYDYRGEIIAAISASGNLNDIPDEKIEAVADYVKKIALEISRSMGYME
ncbi:MAG: IclR family transcriptional regulator [Proteocatella sp.]